MRELTDANEVVQVFETSFRELVEMEEGISCSPAKSWHVFGGEQLSEYYEPVPKSWHVRMENIIGLG